MAEEAKVNLLDNLFVEKKLFVDDFQVSNLHVGLLLFSDQELNNDLIVPKNLYVGQNLITNDGNISANNTNFAASTFISSVECNDLNAVYANFSGTITVLNDLNIINSLIVTTPSSTLVLPASSNFIDAKFTSKTNQNDLTVDGDITVRKVNAGNNSQLNTTTLKKLTSSNANFENLRIVYLDVKYQLNITGKILQNLSAANTLLRSVFNNLSSPNKTFIADSFTTSTSSISSKLSCVNLNALNFTVTNTSSFELLKCSSLETAAVKGNIKCSRVNAGVLNGQNVTSQSIFVTNGILNQADNSTIQQSGFSSSSNQLLPSSFSTLNVSGNLILQGSNGIYFPDGSFQNSALTNFVTTLPPLTKFQKSQNTSYSLNEDISEVILDTGSILLPNKQYEINVQIMWTSDTIVKNSTNLVYFTSTPLGLIPIFQQEFLTGGVNNAAPQHGYQVQKFRTFYTVGNQNVRVKVVLGNNYQPTITKVATTMTVYGASGQTFMTIKEIPYTVTLVN